MSHGWTYSYWAMGGDGCHSILVSNRIKWDEAAIRSATWLRKVASRIEYFP